MVIPFRDNAPTYEVPWVNLLFIAICVIVFLLQQNHPAGFEQSLKDWGEVPTLILGGGYIPGTYLPNWLRLLTAVFMHAGWDHLLGNMYALWLFGDNIEWLLGRLRYFLFFVACGVLANVASTLLGAQSDMPGIGASGAIAGVLAAYVMIYPRARITSLMWIAPFSIMHLGTGGWGCTMRNISALWYIGTWVAWQLLFCLGAIGSGIWLNLGIYSHVGGAAVGAGLVWLLAIKARIPDAEHETRSAPLSDVIWGDEGSGGVGQEPVASLGDELARLRGIHSARGYQPSEAEQFHDFVAEELVEKGDYSAALQHCREMLQLARAEGDNWRTDGYIALIDEINDHVPGEQDEDGPSDLQLRMGGGRR